MFARVAMPDDVATVARLFIENLWPIAHFHPDLKTVSVEIWQAVHENRVFVVERDGAVIGCAAYAMLKPWYLAELQMWDQGVFVIPEYRKTRAAWMLLEALKSEARRLHKTLIISANTKNTEVAPILAKRYRKIADVFVVVE